MKKYRVVIKTSEFNVEDSVECLENKIEQIAENIQNKVGECSIYFETLDENGNYKVKYMF